MPPRVKKNTGDTPSEDAMLAQLAAGSAPLQMPDLSSADAECAALFATFAEIVNNKLRTREDAERAARSHENARSIVDRAISALEQCALPAIVAGPEKEQELQSIMERWTRRRTMLMATRPTLPTLLDEGSENDRRVAVEKYRAAFHSAAAAVSAMRKRAVEASEVLRHYLEGVRDLGNAREEYDRCVRDQFRSDADAQKLAAAGEEVYRETMPAILDASIPGGEYLVSDIAVLPKLTGAKSKPGALFRPERDGPRVGLAHTSHGTDFDPTRFGLDSKKSRADSATVAPDPEALPDNIIENETGVRYRVLGRHPNGSPAQFVALAPGDKYYVRPARAASAVLPPEEFPASAPDDDAEDFGASDREALPENLIEDDKGARHRVLSRNADGRVAQRVALVPGEKYYVQPSRAARADAKPKNEIAASTREHADDDTGVDAEPEGAAVATGDGEGTFDADLGF